MADDIKPILLSVITSDGETATSDHHTYDDAHLVGQHLCLARGCTGYVIEQHQQNGLSMPVILEVWP